MAQPKGDRRFSGHSRAKWLDFDHADIAIKERAAVLIALDEALERLAALNPRLSQVVECRFFGGMTEEETAAALGVTDRTVRRDWVKARGWLHQELATLRQSDASPS